MITEIIKNQNIFPVFSNSLTVQKVAEADLPTDFGGFRIVGYKSLIDKEEYICLYKGKISEYIPTLVRIHSQCLTGDVFHSTKCDCGPQLRQSMQLIADAKLGVIVYQQQEGRGIGIINKIRAYALQDKGADTIEANLQLGLEVDSRKYEQCVEILRDLGLKKVKVMSNNPDKIQAMRDGGLDVVERVALEFAPSENTFNYLHTKKTQMGHILQLTN